MDKRSSYKKVRSQVKRITAIVLTGIMLFTLQRQQAAAVTQQDIDDANAAFENNNKLLKETQDKIDKLEKDRADTEKYIRQIDEEVAKLDGEIDSLNEQIGAKQDDIAKAQTDLENAQVEADAQYESMKLRIKYMYENGTDMSYLNMIMQSSDMSDLLNKAEYINKITKYDRQMLDELANLMAQIEETKNLLQADLEALEVLQISLGGQKQALEVMQKTKLDELARLNRDTQASKAYQEKLKKENAEAEKYIANLEAELRRQEEADKNNGITVPGYDGGKFKWPTPSTRITSPWGDMEDRSSPHKGVDIGALVRGVSGDPIYAAYDGTVVTSTYSSSAGNWIWINHGDGLMTVYMHCSKLLVSVGDKVKKGDKIALMGTTGNSSGVHLHFGVRLNGSYVNPMPYFG